jgi:hypothetical protein
MSDPKLILLDEISLGLAPLIVNELYRALKEIREKQQKGESPVENLRRKSILKESKLSGSNRKKVIAGITIISPFTSKKGSPLILISALPSNIYTRASNGVVCSLNS